MKRTILYCIISSIIFFIASFYLSNQIFDFLLSLFGEGDISFIVLRVNSTFLSALKLSISIAIIPMLLLIAWIAGGVATSRSKILSILIVIGSIIIAIMINVFRIKRYDTSIVYPSAHVTFPLQELHFEYSIGIGAIAGAIISYFIFRRREGA